MSTELIVALVVAFILFDIAILLFVLNRSSKAKMNAHYQWLADTLGLTLAGGEPVFPALPFLSFLRRARRVEGVRSGSPIQIYQYTVSSGNNSTTYTTVRAEVANPRALSFKFSREGLMARLGKALGMQDVTTGDARFDDAIRVKCNDPDFIRQALIPRIREKFLSIWEQHKARGAIVLEGSRLSYDETGVIRNERARERIAAVADLIGDLAGVVLFYNRPAGED